MKCYRSNCDCDKYKKMGCVFRLTEGQKELIATIKRSKYCECGEVLIKAKYKGKQVNLCTSCGVRDFDKQEAV